jgi:hypothetical protein
MPTLARELRKELEKTVTKARAEAEVGARKALEEYAVQEPKAYGFMDQQRQELRERLRARGLQAGDSRSKDGSQSIHHLCAEFAYEHWHRMLFARFLAENGLLIPPGQEPGKEMAISLDECRELAKDGNKDWLTLASEYAQHMLPAIFRADDPVLELSLPLESRNQIEKWLKELPGETFLADDSLGWVYQFWQAKRKDEVNGSGVKIGADEIAPVTQLFTEDYMVLFLLHNTLGAWWAAKRNAEGKPHDLPGYEWTYLRFKDDGSPAAGGFEGWPTLGRDLKVLDPCMGSGHFLVFALPILVGFRMQEEGLSKRTAITAVMRDNLFGLEIDPRCTQIAAFNLALTAWKMGGGHFKLPQLNLACSGLGIHAREEDWIKLTGKDPLLRETMKELYQLFKQAPILGSLIDPKRIGDQLFAANLENTRRVLKQALESEHLDVTGGTLAVTAQGLVKATAILSDHFDLIVTNVPYLKRGKQSPLLTEYADSRYVEAKGDLATLFLRRFNTLTSLGGSVAAVTPHAWQYLGAYKHFRKHLLGKTSFHLLVPLGAGAFETIGGEIVNVSLLIDSPNHLPKQASIFCAIDVSQLTTPGEKASGLRTCDVLKFAQQSQLTNPDGRVVLGAAGGKELLAHYATGLAGILAGDSPRFDREFWEVQQLQPDWEFFQTTVTSTQAFGGRSGIVLWENERGQMYQHAKSVEHLNHVAQNWLRGKPNWGKAGVVISLMGDLPATLYMGDRYDCNCCALIPHDTDDLPALWTYVSSDLFRENVRNIDQSLKVTPKTLLKIPFDLSAWKQLAMERYPMGLPQPYSTNPTQWLFMGIPCGSEQALQVSVARLLGYRWPRQTGASFPDCQLLGEDGLEPFAAEDGIVCLNALQGKPSAANRFSELLAAAYGKGWPAKQQELLKQAGAKSTTIEDWLRDEFFAQHCDLFHNRPFIWHISDGVDQGFHALLNYHKLAEPNGGGRRTLDKLTYSYLGDWIERQRNQQKQGIAGSDARLASAMHLQDELKKILAGEKPYDIFIRWKALYELPIGWEPDINDGVRMNIRPFITARPLTGKGKNACILRVRPGTALNWKKDRGTEPVREMQDFPWFWTWDEQTDDFTGGEKFDGNRWNDLHYSLETKRKARAHHEATSKKVQHA